jgi:hypothetical protein
LRSIHQSRSHKVKEVDDFLNNNLLVPKDTSKLFRLTLVLLQLLG